MKKCRKIRYIFKKIYRPANKDLKRIDHFIDNELAKEPSPHSISLNIYHGEGKDAEIKRENLRFYLKKMRILKPSRLFVGEAPGVNGCFWTGIPFTDIGTLIGNKFFQERMKKLLSKMDFCEKGKMDFKIKEIDEKEKTIRLIINSCNKKVDKIRELFESEFFCKRKKELEDLIICLCVKENIESKKIEGRVKLICSIINSCKEENLGIKTEEIKERVELVCSITDSCNEKGFEINDISELTSSTVWGCLNQLREKGFKLPLLWNIYPFQPWEDGEEGKENRPPENNECDAGVKFLKMLLDCFPSIKYIHAVGRKSEKALERKMYFYMRHPAKGGASEFKRQFSELYKLNQTI